ncbi:MAG: histidinol-phosphate transaminase [Myxococcales bacterium]|nr:histidinol-phosphate transaminase [Myxococcales bacterium]MCB9577197.1 histidinol-phosphate transaminase [Polyangiaceae bacterium]
MKAERRVTRAVVLAAGTGSRLGNGAAPTPKPLRPVFGVPLLVRVLRTLQEAGIQQAVVVVGHRGDEIRRVLTSEPSLGLEIAFVDNDRYLDKNGVSLLAAAQWVDRECILTMADHLYSPELVRRLLSADLTAGTCALGVDFDIERCFDIDDATKVRLSQGRITDIEKELSEYDAIDTGVFRIGPELIRELAVLDARDGDCSLSDGVRALAARGKFVGVDVGDVRWIDVDTPAALERAEAMLRVFGDALGDEPGAGVPQVVDPEAMEMFAPSWVRAVKPYNEDHFAIADRGDVVRMMSNESPFAPSERVLAAILDAARNGHLYPSGGPALRKKLADREGFSDENVILGAGSTELIDVVIRTFVGAGEEVLLSVPTFSMYEARTRTVGGIPVLVPMTEDHDHDMLGLLRAVTERTKVIFLCTPNNPTGNRVPEADLRRILRLGLPTVIDEAYFELGSSESYAYLLKEFPNAIVLRTFSKAFGLAGLRLGYAFAHAALIRLLSRVKVPWNVPAITLAAASAALDDVAEQESRLSELRTARAELAIGLSRIPGVVALPSDGNFILVDVSGTRMSADDIVRLILAQGILIRSLASHHANKTYVRVTVGTREQNRRCVAAFERAVSRVPAREVGVPAYAMGSDAE